MKTASTVIHSSGRPSLKSMKKQVSHGRCTRTKITSMTTPWHGLSNIRTPLHPPLWLQRAWHSLDWMNSIRMPQSGLFQRSLLSLVRQSFLNTNRICRKMAHGFKRRSWIPWWTVPSTIPLCYLLAMTVWCGFARPDAEFQTDLNFRDRWFRRPCHPISLARRYARWMDWGSMG